jgi:transcriptional regulator with XRE-family HTH domain
MFAPGRRRGEKAFGEDFGLGGDVMTAAASRRQLHTELQRLRLAAGVSQTEVARAQEWSPSKVHRIEKGHVSVSRPDLLALLNFFGITDAHYVENLLELARLSRNTPMPFADYRDVFTPEMIRFLGYEASATWIGELALVILPGLLQTPEYTRALIGEGLGMDDGKVAKVVDSRRRRQQVLGRPVPPTLHFLLDEAVLSRAVGGPETMRRQLAHLREAATRPNVTIQVLPLSLGAHAGLRGSFVYLGFGSEGNPDVIYVEARRGDSFDDDVEAIAAHREVFRGLTEQASSPGELDEYLDRALDTLK